MIDNISLSLVMPVYNEQDNVNLAIEKTMEEICKFNIFELIVVDDGSIDNTNKKLVDLSMKYNKLKILKHNKNEGLAKSLKDGFNEAINNYIIFNSADLPLNPKDISNIFEKKYQFDLLVIERKKYNGATLWRKFVSFCNRVILHIFFPLALIDIADCNFTFIFKKEILKNIFPGSKSPGFVQPEMILKAKYFGYNIETINVDYNKREKGESHIGKIEDFLLTFVDIIKFRICSILIILRKNENNIRN